MNEPRDDAAAQQKQQTATREDLEDGLKYVHLVGEGLRNQLAGTAVNLYSLLDLLIRKGVISYPELEQARGTSEQAARQGVEAVPGVALGPAVEKYDPALPVDVPCSQKLHLCRAACCRFIFALTLQDLQEGVVRWSYLHPYYVARRPDGFCVHCQAGYACGVYEKRPAVCRGFDCRNDKRIWADFEHDQLAPELTETLAAPDSTEQPTGHGQGGSHY